MNEQNLAKRVMDVIPLAMAFIRRGVREIPRAELTFPHYRLLVYLSREDEAPTNNQLAEWQGVSVAAMSRTVDTLCKRGLVERHEGVDDRRQIRIDITKKGRDVLARARASIETKVAEKIAKLPRSGKKTLGSGLTVLEELFS